MKLEERVARRVQRYPWAAVHRLLDAQGWALLPSLLTLAECDAVRRLYGDDDRFRGTIDMERHRFGRGQYRYFRYPLPSPIDSLRRSLYAELQPVAVSWMARLGRRVSYPPSLDSFLGHCHAQGQLRPTPLLLRYREGDFNRLHQDIYGAVQFPLQVLIALSQQGTDYDGGEVVFVEQTPRTQSQPMVVVPRRGDGLIFTNRDRPAQGSRGHYAVQLRHGASTITRGERFVLGIIFHDAE